MNKVEIVEVKDTRKKDWTLELVTLGAVATTAIGYKLIKNKEIKNLLSYLVTIVICPLAFVSVLHTIDNLTKSNRTVGIEAYGNNFYEILKALLGSDWRSFLTVSDYNMLKENFKENDEKCIKIGL